MLSKCVGLVGALHALLLHCTVDLSSINVSAALYVYLDESGKFHDGSGYICLCWPAPRKLRRNEVESVAWCRFGWLCR
jgi:hypothetical protein